jgi:cyclopropane-fatty-acyl-phospholipid synthase
VRITDRATLLALFVNPEFNFGEAYSTGSVEVEGDLVQLLEAVNRAIASAPQAAWARRLIKRLNLAHANNASTARDNISHHYDVGNEFYRLWLDRDMLYTCAYFPTADATLEEAQIAKMDHVCRKLRLQPGETVVEAGCGWGSLALHMGTRYGVRVRAFNISHEQMEYARARAKALGASGSVEFIEDDYRNINGRYDAFVSVGMLEHVGLHNYDEFGRIIDRSLARNGRGFLHSIGRIQPAPMNAWIEKRIFPGAYAPTLSEMLSILEPRDFSVLDVENLRLHYALTLKHWLDRFEAARERVRQMYDERFTRAWQFYLAGSMAAFNTGYLQLFQVLFARGKANEVPWTRAHLYSA